ncbi:MAG: [citrate (pro-3S)-lyase] ligase [Peptococcaceae bacterium]|nr:[citrate (pro-3S)-lyase] ligase [Peptococcaceae bacterium]
MYGQVDIEVMDNDIKRNEVKVFLARFDLTFEDDLEYTIALRLDGKLVGTGSFKDEVLRNIAIDEKYQGLGLNAIVVSELIKEQTKRGRLHYFVFTKPGKAHLFTGLGFKEIARVEPYVALLETGLGSIDTFCDTINDEAAHLKPDRAALVVNCNPFTKGHRALIQRAAGENEAVLVFVVNEDRSLFPFADRFKLVKEGVADLPNVVVVPSGKYIISNATFPSYFIRDEDKVIAQTRLDITVFAQQIAPRLGIKRRYVGEEPYCPVTSAYNTAMFDILPKHGIEINIMKRIEVQGEIVSASKVRDFIRNGDWEGIQRLVPEVTYRYLKLPSTQPIINKIKLSDTRH